MDPDLNHAFLQAPDQSRSLPHIETSTTAIETSSTANVVTCLEREACCIIFFPSLVNLQILLV